MTTLRRTEVDRDETRAQPGPRDLLLVVGVALSLRLLFMALTAGLYDYDEFVLLTLARDMAHGAIPYHDFEFFHPPGALVVLRSIEPISHLWWPAARVACALLDSFTAAMVWYVGRRMTGPATGRIAGLLYAISPLAIVSSVRVGQDPMITALGLLGLVALLRSGSLASAFAAGVCLGLAVWIKYPALFFLPVYAVAAPRRLPPILAAAAASFLLAVAPLHDSWRSMFQQTVIFQQTRWLMDTGQKLETIALWWLAVNGIAVVALGWIGVTAAMRKRLPQGLPVWVVLAFLFGGLFASASQVYYHYFAPVAPFGCLLGGWFLARVGPRTTRAVILLGAGVTVLWATFLSGAGTNPLYVTAGHLSDVARAVAIFRHGPPGPVLADRFEYAYLSGRPALDHYFWNTGVLVDAHYLQRRARDARFVVLSRGPSSGFPAGFQAYLDARFRRIDTASNTIWVPNPSPPVSSAPP